MLEWVAFYVNIWSTISEEDIEILENFILTNTKLRKDNQEM
jgi:hypothetical protein